MNTLTPTPKIEDTNPTIVAFLPLDNGSGMSTLWCGTDCQHVGFSPVSYPASAWYRGNGKWGQQHAALFMGDEFADWNWNAFADKAEAEAEVEEARRQGHKAMILGAYELRRAPWMPLASASVTRAILAMQELETAESGDRVIAFGK